MAFPITSETMRRLRSWARWAITGLFALSLLPIINLNVERLAETKGWDRILSRRWDGVISEMSSIAESSIFLIILGAMLGATLVMWVDYFVRRFVKTSKKQASSSNAQVFQKEADDLYLDIEDAKAALIENGNQVSYEGFNEVFALIIKLTKLSIPTPAVAYLKKECDIEYESFNEDFYMYFATIAPYVRNHDYEATCAMAESAIKQFRKNARGKFSQGAVHESQSQQDTE